MAKAKKAIPDGANTITPHLAVKGAVKAMEFYKKAFGATEISRMEGPGGSIMHAWMKIGDSNFFLADEMPEQQTCVAPPTLGGTTVVLNLYVADCDKVFNQAVAAGAKSSMAPADQFWGDRYGQLTDPYGHVWGIATHIEDLSPAEMEERGRQFMASHRN